MELLHKELTSQVIGAYYKVFNNLGFGFLEKVYENSLCIELNKLGIPYTTQSQIKVYYEENHVGTYYADIVVDNKLIIEIKAMESLREEHEFQLVNYLRATDVELGLLFNFGKISEYKRKIFMNKNKNPRKSV